MMYASPQLATSSLLVFCDHVLPCGLARSRHDEVIAHYYEFVSWADVGFDEMAVLYEIVHAVVSRALYLYSKSCQALFNLGEVLLSDLSQLMEHVTYRGLEVIVPAGWIYIA